MDSIRRRQFYRLEYGDPTGFLRELRKYERQLQPLLAALPERTRRLRTNGLKREREMRDAALFCHGMAERLGRKVLLSPTESDDFDFVALDCGGGEPRPVQLKELAPSDCNSKASLRDVMVGLARYADAADLTVAIRLSRDMRFGPDMLRVANNIHLGSLWVFGCISADQSQWALWGDFATRSRKPGRTVFAYPE